MKNKINVFRRFRIWSSFRQRSIRFRDNSQKKARQRNICHEASKNKWFNKKRIGKFIQ